MAHKKTLKSKYEFKDALSGSKFDKLKNLSNFINLREAKKKDINNSTVVKWLKESADKLENNSSGMENFTKSALTTFALLLLGIFYRGEWLLILVHFSQHIAPQVDDSIIRATYLGDFVTMWILAVLSAYGMYFVVCGTLHWYYYVRKRDKAEEWKCQPYKWITPEMERREILHGFHGLFWTNTVTAAFATYLLNDGPTMIYWEIDGYGWSWLFLQVPVLFLAMEYITYWFHRFYHLPFMYKRFHKLHHGFKQPTAWSATAIHPVELVNLQLLYITLLFIIPTHMFCFISIMLYNYYYGLLDHSGIKFKSWWQPWKPDSTFHDNHHQYTHVNYGFNMFIWDKMYGTHREKGRIYNENIFSGKGKKMSEATKEELELYNAEVSSENKTAFQPSLFEKILQRVT